MTLLLHIKEANFHINTIKYSWNYRVIDDIDVFSELKAMLDRARAVHEYIASKIVDQNLCGSSQYTCLYKYQRFYRFKVCRLTDKIVCTIDFKELHGPNFLPLSHMMFILF